MLILSEDDLIFFNDFGLSTFFSFFSRFPSRQTAFLGGSEIAESRVRRSNWSKGKEVSSMAARVGLERGTDPRTKPFQQGGHSGDMLRARLER